MTMSQLHWNLFVQATTRPPLSARSHRSLCSEINGIERRCPADAQPIAFGSAEADIGDNLRYQPLAQQCAVGRVAVHAVAGAAPQIAVDIEAKTVEQADRAVREHFAAAEAAAIGGDVEAADVVRSIGDMRGAGIGDVEHPLVGGKGETAGLDEIG